MSKMRKVKVATNITMRMLLKVSVGAGFVGVVIVAPNALQAVDYFINQYDKSKKRKPRFREQFKRSGYFYVSEVSSGSYAVSLTEKGRAAANNVLFEDYKIATKSQWDGKWHLLMFDIAEKDRVFRDSMRRKIKELGLLQLQNSVYIYPYSLKEFALKVKDAYPYQSDKVVTVTAERISDNRPEKIFTEIGLIN